MWWLGDPEMCHEKVVPTARRIIRNQAGQDQADREWLAMYYGGTAGPVAPYSITKAVTRRARKVTYNIVKSVIDSFAAEMVQSKPKATVLTQDGDHALQLRAKAMEKWYDGMFHDLGFYDVRRQAWTDAGIWGDGLWKVWEERTGGSGPDDGEETEEDAPDPEDKICLERVQAPMLVADDGECRDGKPRSVYERRWVDRRVAMAQWPEKAMQIRDARRDDADEQTPGFDSTADQILIWEAFHRPSRKGAADGLHAICIEGATLFHEPWEDAPTPHGFPYVWLRRVDPPEGLRAVSGAEELSEIQKEINTLTKKRARGLKIVGVPHWIVEKGSINLFKLDDVIGSVIEVKTGSTFQPQAIVPPAVGPELQQTLADLYSKGYELFGIPQLMATGLKPAGLDSGEAQRVYNNTASQRFKIAQENDERAMLETARLIGWCAERILARGGKVQVKAAHSGRFEQLDFEEIRLAEEEHLLQTFPTSALAREPAERTQQVADWVKAGFIPAKDAPRLLGFPDLEAFQSQSNASHDLIAQIVDDIVERGEYLAPNPLMDLGDAVAYVQVQALRAMRMRVPAERIQMLMTWMKQCQDIPGWPGYVPPAQPSPPQVPAEAGPPQPPQQPGMPPGGAVTPPGGAPPIPPGGMPPEGAPPGAPLQ